MSKRMGRRRADKKREFWVNLTTNCVGGRYINLKVRPTELLFNLTKVKEVAISSIVK